MRNSILLELVPCLLFSSCRIAVGIPITDNNGQTALADEDFTFGLCGEYPANGIKFCSNVPSKDIDVVETQLVPSSVQIMRLHVDSIIQARFAHTVVTSHIQNFLPSAQNFSFSLPVPATALVSGFSLQVDGNIYHAHPVKKTKTVIRTTPQSSAVVTISDSMTADVTVTLEAHKVTVFKLIYEELLSRNVGVYSSTVYLKPRQIVQDLQVRFLIYETIDIKSVKVGKLRNDKLYANATATVFQPTPRSAEVLFRPSVSDQVELAQVLNGRQRAFFKSKATLQGHISIEYELDGYPTCGEIIVKDDHFVQFFSPLNPTEIPKHVVLVLIMDSAMDNMVESCRKMINSIALDLSPEDTFTIVQQGNTLKTWDLDVGRSTVTSDADKCRTYRAADYSAKLLSNSNYLTRDFVSGVQDSGAALRKGLECASLQAELSDNQPIVLFMTPVAIPNSDQIEQSIREANLKNGKLLASIYTAGFGSSVDVGFLHRISIASNGKSVIVPDGADYDQYLENLYEAVASPQLLKDVSISYENSDVDKSTITNANFHSLFKGTELVVAGQISKERKEAASGEMVGIVSAQGKAGELNYQITAEDSSSWTPLPLEGTPLLERLWAFLKVTQQLEKEKFPRDLATPQESQMKSEITDLALQYSFLTPTTCLLLNREKPESISTTMPGGLPWSTGRFPVDFTGYLEDVVG